MLLASAVPKIEIVGESELYVKAGTTVSLKCVITQALEEPAYIFWYHNDERVLNYDKSLVEIRMERVAPDTTVRLPRLRRTLAIAPILPHTRPGTLTGHACVAGGQPHHLQSAARGLRELLVFALQPRLRVCHAARAQRSVLSTLSYDQHILFKGHANNAYIFGHDLFRV